jgi:hypothetical protein
MKKENEVQRQYAMENETERGLNRRKINKEINQKY